MKVIKIMKGLAAFLGFLLVTSGAAGQESSDEAEASVLEEILVTANRRETSLQNTSMAISVLSGVELEKNGIVSVSDVINTVPGVSLLSDQPGQTEVIMRGVNTSGSAVSGAETIRQSTTAAYLDDFVVGNTFIKTPDIQLVDMSRVEVLKGPQGTLYGQSAMGGVLRYITNKPDNKAFYGGVTLAVSSTKNGDNGYRGQGYLNIPLTDKLAVRVVGYDFNEAGFIDSDAVGSFPNDTLSTLPGTNTPSVFRGKKDHNETDVRGGRLALRWQPTDRITVDAMYQTQDIDSSYQVVTSTFDPTRYSFPNSHIAPPDGFTPPNFHDLTAFAFEPYYAKNDSLNLKLDIDFDNSNLSVMASKQSSDILYVIRTGPLTDVYEETYWPDRDNFSSDVDTLELRLVSDASQERFVDWLAGLWYENTNANASVLNMYFGPDTADPLYGIPGLILTDGLLLSNFNRFYQSNEFAGYGEVAVHLMDRTTLTLGYRRSHVEINTGFDKADGTFDFVVGRDALIGLPSRSQENVDTFKVKLAYDVNEDIMLFAQATSGYRPGGLNSGSLLTKPTPFTSDTLWNFELGAKTAWLDGRWVVNVSGYVIEWTNMQLEVQDFFGDPPTFTSLTANVGKAEIKGVELESNFQATENLNLGVNIAYTDAQLKEDYDPDGPGGADPVAFDGERLPGVADWTYSLFAHWRKPLTADWDLDAGVTYRYVGERSNLLSSGRTGLARANPSYDRTDIRLGLARANGLMASIFVNNLFNEIGQLGHGRAGTFMEEVQVTRPRTIGLQLNYSF